MHDSSKVQREHCRLGKGVKGFICRLASRIDGHCSRNGGAEGLAKLFAAYGLRFKP